MNIYLLSALEDRGYDYHCGFVVVAHSGGEARRVACTKHFTDDPKVRAALGPDQRNREERKFWTDMEKSSCTTVGVYTGRETAPHVVLSDYHAG